MPVLMRLFNATQLPCFCPDRAAPHLPVLPFALVLNSVALATLPDRSCDFALY